MTMVPRALSSRAAVLTVVLAMLVALALAVAPLAARAQPASRIPRIGVLGDHTAGHPFIAAFREGLRELGHTEGQTIVLEYRHAQGVPGRFPELAAELIRLNVDVLVVGSTLAAQAAKAQTTTVPIVFTLAGDPVGTGLVASLARPGGNVTGVSVFHPEMSAKDLEMLKTAVPQVSRVGVLYNPANPVTRVALEKTREAARALALELQVVEVRRADQLGQAVSTLAGGRRRALLALSDAVFGTELSQLAKLALQHRLPAIYNRREFAEAGGLLAYGPSYSDNYRRAASYVDRILKGTRPADLPVEQPSKFELVVNLGTAKTLGLTLPASLLQRADRVIE